MRNDRKVPKHLFRPTFSSIEVLIITVIFSTIELVESTNRMQSFLHVWIFSPPNPTVKLSILPHKRSKGLCCLGVTCPEGVSTSP
jgi:hypothetical protein